MNSPKSQQPPAYALVFDREAERAIESRERSLGWKEISSKSGSHDVDERFGEVPGSQVEGT